MASWTDEIQKFNPYVQQVPVDEYSRAEMYKQGKYDQGVQQVQSYLDETTGLNVDPKYKDYLQGAVTSLQDQVKKVAGSDFSNMQLVNQVGGAASRIVGDKIVQAGVVSASNWGTQQERRDDAIKDGKSAAENNYDLDNQYSQWSKNTDLATPFEGSYSPYIDVNKKWLAVVKDLHEDSKLDDIPFETIQNADGTVSTGKLADVMVKKGISGIEASKIENAIRASLTPDDNNQLAISARYQFRGATPDQLTSQAQTKYQSRVQDETNSLNEAKRQLSAAGSNVAQKAKLQGVIDDYTSRLNPSTGQLKSDYDNEMDLIKTNPDQAKANIYKNGYIAQFSNAFSWKKDSTEYVASPFTQVAQWNKDYAVKLDANNMAHEKFKWDENQDLIKNEFERERIKLESEKADREKGVGSGYSTNLGTAVDVPSPTVAMANDAQDLQNNASQIRQKLKESMNDPNMSDADLDKKIDAYLHPTDQNGGKTVFGTHQLTAVDQSIKATNDAKDIQRVIDVNRKEAEAEVYKSTPTADELLKGLPNINVPYNGTSSKITPMEVYNYLRKETFHPGIATPGQPVTQGYYKIDDPSKLTDNEKALQAHMTDQFGIDKEDYNNSFLNSHVAAIRKVMNTTDVNEGKVDALLNTKLLKNNSGWVPKIEAMTTPDEKSRNNMESLTNAAILRMKSDKGGNAGSNISDLQGWLGDDKTRKDLYYYHFNQGGKEQLWVSKSSSPGWFSGGTEVARLDITPSEGASLPTKNKVDTGVQEIQRKLDLGNGNTNVSADPSSSMFRPTDFRAVKNLMVTGDLQREVNGNRMYINLNIKTPSGWKNVQLPQPVDITKAREYIQTATDGQILKNAIDEVTAQGNTKMAAELQNLAK